MAQGYHTFATEMYPSAIRIANRFHVNRYVTEALQKVRKSVQKQLAPHAKQELKKYFRILGKRNDQLTANEQTILRRLLGYSPLLGEIYQWKKAFIEWYDCSAAYPLAKKGFVRWLKVGELIAPPRCKGLSFYNEELAGRHL